MTTRNSLDSAPRDLYKAHHVNRVLSMCCNTRAAGAHVPARRYRHQDGDVAAAAQGRTQCSAGQARLHGTPALGNARGSALLALGAVSEHWTATTARLGAPFLHKRRAFWRRAPPSRRTPAPTGAITCSPRSGRNFSVCRLEAQSKQRRQQVRGPGARANGWPSMPAMLSAV